MSKLYSAAEQVYRTVKDQILRAELPGGELISEGEIAALLGVSRTPVREAFLRLEAEGWMRLYPKRGALVVPIADGEAEHVLGARQLIESHSVHVLRGDTPARARLVGALRESLDRQAELLASADVGGFSAEDALFHAAIVSASGNPLLDSFYASLRDRQRRMTAHSITADPLRTTSIIDDHAHLVDLIEAGDADGFDLALWTHMRAVHGLPAAPLPTAPLPGAQTPGGAQ